MAMRQHGARRSPAWQRPSTALILVVAFLILLWFAGGASRPTVPAQTLMRAGTWLLLVVAALTVRPRLTGLRPVLLLLAGALMLAIVQLIPLPPPLWEALPGRAILADAARLSGQPQPWRPWSIVPGATANAAMSLVIPIATLLFVTALPPAEERHLVSLLIVLIALSALVGVLQFSGGGFDNPLINDGPGEVSGFFANRNHFALFTAMGCLLVPIWAFSGDPRSPGRTAAAVGLLLVFILVILASGSRAGMLLGALGTCLGLVLAWRGLKREARRYPRWVLPTMAGGIVVAIVTVVLASVMAGRAVSIQRAFAMDPGQDMRQRGLPIVLAMIRDYFPFGSGLGGFDPLFRMNEPFALLKPTYFNHAHNDFLEILLDAGLFGGLLLAAGLAWWGWASIHAWRSTGSASRRLGSAMLLLVIVASLFDYPARTPIIMAIIVVAAIWLARGIEGEADHPRGSTLPRTAPHL